MRNVRGWQKNIDWSFLARYKYAKVTSTVEKIEIEFTGVMKCSVCEDGATQFEFKNLKANNVCSFVTKMQSKFIRFSKKSFCNFTAKIQYFITTEFKKRQKLTSRGTTKSFLSTMGRPLVSDQSQTSPKDLSHFNLNKPVKIIFTVLIPP